MTEKVSSTIYRFSKYPFEGLLLLLQERLVVFLTRSVRSRYETPYMFFRLSTLSCAFCFDRFSALFNRRPRVLRADKFARDVWITK